MENQIEVRIEVSGTSVIAIYFWQKDQRSESLNLYGPADEITIEGSSISESIFAWVTIKIQKKKGEKNKLGWEVVYNSNVKDNNLQDALEKVKRKIETAIEKGAQARIVLNDDLKLAEWETVLPQAAA
jgi:hypothetical protein